MVVSAETERARPGPISLKSIENIKVKKAKAAMKSIKNTHAMRRLLLLSEINPFPFFKGIELSTPINSSVLITVTPILVFVFSRILIKEKFVAKRIWGVVLGFIGALVLIVFGNEARQDAPNIPVGNFHFIINASDFAIY